DDDGRGEHYTTDRDQTTVRPFPALRTCQGFGHRLRSEPPRDRIIGPRQTSRILVRPGRAYGFRRGRHTAGRGGAVPPGVDVVGLTTRRRPSLGLISVGRRVARRAVVDRLRDGQIFLRCYRMPHGTRVVGGRWPLQRYRHLRERAVRRAVLRGR